MGPDRGGSCGGHDAVLVVLILPLLLAPLGSGARWQRGAGQFSIRQVLVYLIGYFLFGAGYIAYMTFMIAYVRDAGGGATAQVRSGA